MRYSDPSQGLEIKLSAGKQHLDGAEAIQLVRFRSGYAMADITRTSVQRDFVKAAFTQWASVKSVVKLPVLMGILRKNVTTDLSAANMMWLCRAILSCGVSNMFPPGFTCPAVLWILAVSFLFRLRDSHAL